EPDRQPHRDAGRDRDGQARRIHVRAEPPQRRDRGQHHRGHRRGGERRPDQDRLRQPQRPHRQVQPAPADRGRAGRFGVLSGVEGVLQHPLMGKDEVERMKLGLAKAGPNFFGAVALEGGRHRPPSRHATPQLAGGAPASPRQAPIGGMTPGWSVGLTSCRGSGAVVADNGHPTDETPTLGGRTMFGPKLDSKSYTTFLLIVIGVLLSLNLFAQMGTTPTYDTTAATDRIAQSNQAVAAATERVAAANLEIAQGLQAIAMAIQNKRELDVNVKMLEGGAGSSATEASPAPAPADEAPEPEQPRGTLRVN